MLYVDSSALVKLVIEEAHGKELEEYVRDDAVLATSRLAIVEVRRATALVHPDDEMRAEADRLLASCLLVDVTDQVLREAATLASREIRTFDAIHLATALHIEADELVAYDRRLLAGAEQHGLAVAAPGVI